MIKNRLEALSDGVFAIVMTLLAIELKPFHIEGVSELLSFSPHLFLFVLSFITIAIFWVNHHHLFHALQNVSHRVLWINISALLFVTLVPFATALLGENRHSDLALAFYAVIMLGASFCFYALRKLIHIAEQRVVLRSLVGPICYGLALISAFVYQPLAYLFIAVPLVYYIVPAQHSSK